MLKKYYLTGPMISKTYLAVASVSLISISSHSSSVTQDSLEHAWYALSACNDRSYRQTGQINQGTYLNKWLL